MLRQRAITNNLIFEIIGFGKIYQTLRTIFLMVGGGGGGGGGGGRKPLFRFLSERPKKSRNFTN